MPYGCKFSIYLVELGQMSPRPTTPAQTSLIPVNDCVLVQLDHTDKKETKYETRTSGIIMAIPRAEDMGEDEESTKAIDKWNIELNQARKMLNKHVYFEEYKEGARIKRDGELFCFIKLEDIRGFEEVA